MKSRGEDDGIRYAAFFHELDAWTEYWDVYHPESKGRFYFGDGARETGLLTRLLRGGRGCRSPFQMWRNAALNPRDDTAMARAVCQESVAGAVIELDALVHDIFVRHFADATQPAVQVDYLRAMHCFAVDSLPPAEGRAARIADDDPRKDTAGRHTLDGDVMWFAWAFHLEASQLLCGADRGRARRALQLAGVAAGCAANFAWRGHRRTRVEYAAEPQTAQVLATRGLAWASDFAAAVREVRALYRIREWGE